MPNLPSYTIHQARIQPDIAGARAGDWGGPAWVQAETLNVSQFRPESSDARPRTQAKLLYVAHGIYGMFKVEDHYVRCTHVGYQAAVYRDSCVEFFVQPKSDRGYFNFEFNCGGSLLCSYVTDPARGEGGALAEAVRLPDQAGEQVQVTHSLPQMVDPEMVGPVSWMLVFFIPFSILSEYVGPLSVLPGQVWRANLYKCAEDNSHPHWAAWSPVDELNFHLPHCFGTLVFAG